MTPYNSDLFDPPAPLATIEVRSLEGESMLVDIPMLLDSGADVS